MKNMIRTVSFLLLLAMLLVSTGLAEEVKTDTELAAQVLPGATSLKKQSLKSKYTVFEGLGVENEVIAVWKASAGYVFQTRVHYGTEFYEEPVMDVFTGIDKQGQITGVAVGTSKDHTPAFLGMVTQEKLDAVYLGRLASSTLTADAVTGATFSSDAVLYGVQTACWYAANVYRLGEREVQDIQLKKLASIVPGTYEKLDVDLTFICDEGSVQYAARGTDESGNAFYAVITQAAYTPSNPDNNMAMPTYQIWISAGDGKVFMANMLAGHFYEAFPMPADKLAAYYGIPLASGEEYDFFADGLVTDAEEYTLTSATQAFPDTKTGATAEGNDTSLSVRNCFITAARYYVQVLKD